MPEAARLGDMHTCPRVEPGPTPHVGGPINSACSEDVFIADMRAARVSEKRNGDYAKCEAGGPDYIAEGSPNVFINDMGAVRKGDRTQHIGVITCGEATVEIGVLGDAKQYLPFSTKATPRSNEDGGGEGKSPGTEDGEENPGEDKGQQQDGATSVASRYKLLTPEPIVEGGVAEVQCWSYDPDTGGTESAPNSDQIVWRNWELVTPQSTGGSHTTYTPADGRNTKLAVPPLGPTPATQLMLSLFVKDRQGDEDNRGRGIAVRPTRPVAKIKPLPTLSMPGGSPPAMFECVSLYDEAATEEPPGTHLVRRTWTLRGPNFEQPLIAQSGQTGADSRVEIPRSLVPPVGDGSLTLELEIENSYGRRATASTPVATVTPPVAKLDRDDAAPWKERLNWRPFGPGNAAIDGDELLFASASHMEGFDGDQFKNVGIDWFEWEIRKDGYVVEVGSDSSLTWVPTFRGAYEVLLKVGNTAGKSETSATFSVLSSIEAFTSYLEQLAQSGGVGAVIGALFALVAGAAVLPAAIAGAIWSIGSEVVKRFMMANGSSEVTATIVSVAVELGPQGLHKLVSALATGSSGEAIKRALVAAELTGSTARLKREIKDAILLAARQMRQPISEEAAELMVDKIIDTQTSN